MTTSPRSANVVYDSERGSILGFTLNKRGWFGGRLKERLPVDAVHAIGRGNVVMVASDADLVDAADAPAQISAPLPQRDAIGVVVLTDDGTCLGPVTDVIVALGEGAHAVGYEVRGERGDGADDGVARFIPLPEQLAVSGDAAVVPEEVDSFVRDDLTGFGAAVTEFRLWLHEPGAPPGTSG